MVEGHGEVSGIVKHNKGRQPPFSSDLPRVGWWSWDIASDTIVCSALVARLFQIEPGEKVKLERFLSVVNPEDRSRLQRAVEGLIGEHKPVYDFRFHITLPAGLQRYVSISALAVPDAEGAPAGAEGIVQDVTGATELVPAARRSDELYVMLAEAAEDFIYIIDRDYHVSFLNQAGAGYIGRKPGEVIGRPLRELFPPKTCDQFARNLRDVFEKGASMTDLHNFWLNGREYWLHAKLTPIRDADGEVTHVMGISRDITDRRRAEEALARSEKKFRAMADTTAAAVCIVRDGRIAYANRAMAEGTGYTHEELIGMDAFTFADPECREAMVKLYAALTGGHLDSTRFEFKGVKKDGSVRWLDATAGVLDGADRGAIVITGLDVTKRKLAEEELVAAKSQAELYVDLMGHDINNINQIALGYLELLHDQLGAGDERRAIIVRATEALLRSSRLIRNVRKLQQISSRAVGRERIDLGEMIDEIVDQFDSAGEKRAIISYRPSEGCYVYADGLLYDVFINLIDNSIKHTVAPEVRIDIALEKVAADGRTFCGVTVDDNGPGIPDELKADIFKRQLRGSTQGKGSGIGLYLVSKLVASYGGRAWVEDRVPGDRGKGSRFVVLLPAAE